MAGKPVISWKENLRVLLDKVRTDDNTIYTQIPLFAENNSDHAKEIVSLINDRIQNLDKVSGVQANEIRVKYYYILDAILKKKLARYTKAFEDIVLPRFWEEMVKARSDETLLERLAVLFVTWEGVLKMDLLLDNLKNFYTKLRTFVNIAYLRTYMGFLEKIGLLKLRNSTGNSTLRDSFWER